MKSLLLCTFLFTSTTPILAEVIELKDGSKITGEITGEISGALIVKTKYGTLSITRDDIVIPVSAANEKSTASANIAEDAKATRNTVTATYDKFRDETNVTIPIPQEHGTLPRLWALSTYKGRIITSHPPFVLINFVSESEDWEYLKCNDVNLLADEARVSILDTNHDGHVGDGYVLEYLTSKVSWDEAKKLSTAKSIEVKICNTVFSLSPNNISDLKEFISLLTPKTPETKTPSAKKTK